MNAKKNRENPVPRALREVWEWKEAVRRDTAGLTTAEALKRIHAETETVFRQYDLCRGKPDGLSLRVAEAGAEYGRKDGEAGSTKA